MIATKRITVNKREFIMTKSDTYKIKNENDEVFESAIDTVDTKHTYTETDELSTAKKMQLEAERKQKERANA